MEGLKLQTTANDTGTVRSMLRVNGPWCGISVRSIKNGEKDGGKEFVEDDHFDKEGQTTA
jgi:hypothetical protein